MSEHDAFHDTERVIVLVDGEKQVWQVDESTQGDEYIWTLVLTAPNGEVWTSEAQGLWTAFTELRKQVEVLGYQLCCAGARVDANMRHGRWADSDVVDVLSRRTLLGIRRTARIWDYAPPSRVGTVAEQAENYKRWLGTRWWRVLRPGRLA